MAFILLRVDNGAANVLIKQDQFAVGRNRGLDLRDPNPSFDALDKAIIELCTSLLHNCFRDAFPIHKKLTVTKFRQAELRVRLYSSVVVTDRRRRQCRGLSHDARLLPHRAPAEWIEIFPVACAWGVTIPD